MKRLLLFIFILFFLISCSVSPKKIEYGKDVCSFCDMTIVEKTHAAEFVTSKGRVYKFDAIECLLNDLNDKNIDDMAFILVTDYLNPTELINAKEATYLISKEIKSPMGAYLSAFKDKKAITQNGTQYNWKEIRAHFNK